ncbi:MAG: hypothetical protein HY820_21335 [Acidobacteria bacterium]|nr:hypothetical protein [Acidobacteriota bacterium]
MARQLGQLAHYCRLPNQRRTRSTAISSIVFVLVYALIISEKLNRAILALLGAGLLIV